MIYLFVLDDSILHEDRPTNLMLTTAEAEVRLCTCKIDLSPPVITDSFKAILLCSYCFMSWC